MKTLLEALTKFAGEPEQKPGDQVKGTDKPKKGKDHPFKGKLVGCENTEPKSMLKELSNAIDKNSLEWELQEQYAQFQNMGKTPFSGAWKKAKKISTKNESKSPFGGDYDPVGEIDKIIGSTKKQHVTCSSCGGKFNAPRRPDGKLYGFSSCKEHKGMKDLDEGVEDDRLPVGVFDKTKYDHLFIRKATPKEQRMTSGGRQRVMQAIEQKPGYEVAYKPYGNDGKRENAGFYYFGKSPVQEEMDPDYPLDPKGYKERVEELEAEGMTTSDAQGVADHEFAQKGTEKFGIKDKRASRNGTRPARKKDDKVLEAEYVATINSQVNYEAVNEVVNFCLEEYFGGKAWFKGGSYAYLMDINKPNVMLGSDGGVVQIESFAQGIRDYADSYVAVDMFNIAKKYSWDEDFAKEFFRPYTGGPKRGITHQIDHELDNQGLLEGTDNVASIISSEISKLISDGHTEVSPDVIIAKISAATGAPFMLKDLVAANNASPALQHYIDSINPSKIKFSTDLLTVKNEDPMKEKEQAAAGVSKMASRAASRNRSLDENLVNEIEGTNDLDEVRWEKLRDAYKAIQNIDPESPTYQKLIAFLDQLSTEDLQSLVRANIRFISGLARNRVNRRTVKESSEFNEGVPSNGEHRIRSLRTFKRAVAHLGLTLQTEEGEFFAIGKDGTTVMGVFSPAVNAGWIYAPTTDSNAFKVVGESRGHRTLDRWFKDREIGKGPLASKEEMDAFRKKTAEKPDPQAEFDKMMGDPKTSAIFKRTKKAKVVDEAGANNPLQPVAQQAQPVAQQAQQIQKVAAATNTLKSATGSTAPATKIAQAINNATQGTAVNAQDMTALEPMMNVVGQVAQDPALANQFKTLANQAKASQLKAAKISEGGKSHTAKFDKELGACPRCGRTKHWYNGVPLKAFCWGTDESPHREWSKLVPAGLNPYLPKS